MGTALADTTSTASSFHHHSNVSRTLSRSPLLGQNISVPGSKNVSFSPPFSLSVQTHNLKTSIFQDHLIKLGYYVTHDTLYKLMWSKTPLFPDQDKWRLHCAGLITPNLAQEHPKSPTECLETGTTVADKEGVKKFRSSLMQRLALMG